MGRNAFIYMEKRGKQAVFLQHYKGYPREVSEHHLRKPDWHFPTGVQNDRFLCRAWPNSGKEWS